MNYIQIGRIWRFFSDSRKFFAVFKTPEFFESGHCFSSKNPQTNLVVQVHPPLWSTLKWNSLYKERMYFILLLDVHFMCILFIVLECTLNLSVQQLINFNRVDFKIKDQEFHQTTLREKTRKIDCFLLNEVWIVCLIILTYRSYKL